MWGNTVRGNTARVNQVGEDLRSLFVIIKKGENVICIFDDLTNVGNLKRYQVSYLSVADEINLGT